MQIPSSLKVAIENCLESTKRKSLIKARQELTSRYRNPHFSKQLITTDEQRLSYLISRLPATFAAIMKSLQAIQERKILPIKSVLDLGAGPGTAMWAACEIFPEVETVTLIEKDRSLIDLGKYLAQHSDLSSIKGAKWIEEDLETIKEIPFHDLIIFSYSIGELQSQPILPLLNKCWNSVLQLLVIIEPGTPIGFERIRSIRRQLIDYGAYLIAPCPHQVACPMAGGDWCHFSARVERSADHRLLKQGRLSYEDEKFSYIAATKKKIPLPDTRVLSTPIRHSGHIVLKLCTNEGIKQPIISKKMGENYKLARKLEWGDIFNKFF